MSDGREERRLEAFFENSPDAIVVVDESGRIVRTNERVEDLFGYERAELEGEPVEALVPEPDREQHPAHRESYMEDPRPRPMGAGLDLRARRKDGTTFPVDISLSPLETETGFEVIAAVRDVTKQEEYRRKYRTLMKTAPDAMFIADAETGELLEVNRQATELVGLPEEDLVGREHTVLHPDDDADRYRALFRRHVEDEQSIDARFYDGDDLYVETADGDRIPVEISVRLTRLSGRPTLVALFRDISQRRAYEERLHRQIDRLETLSYILSHDLRTPLNVASGNLQHVRETGDLDRLSEVEDAHERIEAIVEDVLAMIRGGYEIESVEPIEFETLVDDCWENVATRGATIRIDSDGLVYADSKRVRNLFENLFRNAVEHAGDDVTVVVGLTDDGFYVADDGPGIPESMRSEVFEVGWTTADSTGLGLRIVAEVAEAHGWQVDVGESDDGGARFEFSGVRTAVYDDAYQYSGT